MRKSFMPLTGIGHWATVCPGHLTNNDEELRKIFQPGIRTQYYPETIEILEEEGIVLIGVIPDYGDKAEMVIVQLAKLSFSESQFVELLKTVPGLYNHYQERLRRADPSISGKMLSYREVHRRLKESCLSTENTLLEGDLIAFDDEENFLEIMETAPRRLRSLGPSMAKA